MTDRLANSYKDLATYAKKAEGALKSSNEQFEKNNKLLGSTKTAVEAASREIKDLSSDYEELAASQTKASTASENLNLTSEAFKDRLKETEKSIKESADGYEYLKETFESLDKTLDNLKEKAGKFAPELEKVKTGFSALKTGLDVVKDGFNGVGSALKATGFGLLMLIIKSLEEYFQKDTIGLKRFQGALAAIGVVTKEIENALAKLGGAIIDALIHPVDTIKEFWHGLVEKFSKTFSALGDIISGVFTLDSGKIKAGVTQLGVKFNKAVTVIKNGYEHARSYLTNLAHKAVDEYNDAYKKRRNKTCRFR